MLMPNLMPNIALLRDDLKSRGWCITAFQFCYNQIDYIVLFEVLDKKIEKNQYYIALLTFLDLENNRDLKLRANSQSFDVDPREFREFFHIDYAPNLGDLFSQFYLRFNNYVPQTYQTPTPEEREEIINQLNNRDHDNANYCFSVVRNGKSGTGKQKHRSIFNDNKTRLLRPDLYNYFKDDKTISFHYSNNPADEKSTNEIIKSFVKSSIS